MILKPALIFGVVKLVKSSSRISISGNPSCDIPQNASDVAVWSKCPFDLDPDVWYGVSNEKFSNEDGIEFCKQFDAELISVKTENIDKCAANILDTFGIFDESVLYSGSYFPVFEKWAWCEEGMKNKCSSLIRYSNWLDVNDTETIGRCMNGRVEVVNEWGNSTEDTYEYGWTRSDCSEASRVMCRLNCNDSLDGKSDSIRKIQQGIVAQQPFKSELEVLNQKIIYSIRGTDKIYLNEIDENGLTGGSQEFDLPYSHCGSNGMPYLAYNKEKQVVEILGDYWNNDCPHHYFFHHNAGQFEINSESMFTPTLYGQVVYVPAIGTVSISGYELGSSSRTEYVKVITQSAKLPKIAKSGNSLNSLVGSATRYYTAVVNDDAIYVIGGYDSGATTDIQFVDYSGVKSYNHAKSRNWIILGYLNNGFYHGTAQIYNNQLIMMGGYVATQSEMKASGVEILDLATDKIVEYKNVFPSTTTYGNRFAGSFINNGKLTYFGGRFSLSSCVEQTLDLDKLNTTYAETPRITNPFNLKCIGKDDTKLSAFTEHNSERRLSYANIID